MNNVQFLMKNAPHVLKDFEDLTVLTLRLKMDLRDLVKDGNDKLINDAIIYHVTEFLKHDIPNCPECGGNFSMDSDYPEFICKKCGLIADINKVMK